MLRLVREGVMSRIGRAPVIIPENVTVDLTNDNVVIVSGPLGTLRQPVDACITITKDVHEGKNVLHFTRNSEEKEVRSKHGLYRALVHNMVEGVTKGYKKELVVNGVGYKVAIQGNKIVMNIGFSHPVNFEIPNGIKATCPTATNIVIEGFDKTLVGQTASDIKAVKPVEPYHNYGIRYADEKVVKKEIKKAGKKK